MVGIFIVQSFKVQHFKHVFSRILIKPKSVNFSQFCHIRYIYTHYKCSNLKSAIKLKSTNLHTEGNSKAKLVKTKERLGFIYIKKDLCTYFRNSDKACSFIFFTHLSLSVLVKGFTSYIKSLRTLAKRLKTVSD